MIALIVCIIFFVLGIALIAIGEEDKEPLFTTGLICSVVAVIILLASLMAGSSIKKYEKKYLYERHKICIVLEQELSEETISDAQEFNKQIEFGNNYWCRFSIEDRAYLKIDINSYLKNKEDLENENSNK